VLGVTSSTPTKEIKSIYRAFAVEFHPDKLTKVAEPERSEKEERFKMIVRFCFLL
jgi:preprotein translocase subunit Sec63